MIKPLSEATARLLRPAGIKPNDRMRVQLSRDSRQFIVTPYAVQTTTVLTVKGDNSQIPISDIRELERMIERCGGRGEVEISTGEKRTWPSWEAGTSWLNRVPERKKIDAVTGGFMSYELAATDITAIVIDAIWPIEQLVFEDDAKVYYDYLLLTFEQLHGNAERFARFKETREIPADYAYEEHPELPLMPHQKIALYNSCRSEAFDLFMEQGTGKTPVVVARICNESKILRLEEKRAYRTLVVCPKNVRINWVNEINKFKTAKGLATAIRGSKVNRFKFLVNALSAPKDHDFTVCVVSYETISRMPELLTVQWDLVVLDESHYIKSYVTDRNAAALKLREVATRRMCLTGTPIANSPIDLYTQFEFQGQGWSGFQDRKNFKEFYGVWHDTGEGFDKLVGLQNMPFMRERLARQTFIISLKEALPDLPDKVYDIVEVEMTTEQRETYDELRKNLIVEIENDMQSGRNQAIVVNNILTKLLRLAQITSGFAVYTEQPDWNAEDLEDVVATNTRTVVRFDPCPKIDAIVNMLQEKGPLEKTIVWACWVPDIRDLCARLENVGIGYAQFYGKTSEAARADAEHRFNWDPTCKVLVGNPAAGGVGLNLLGYPPGHDEIETNCDHEIYMSQGWSSLHRSQSEARAHRKGTRKPVRVTDLVVPGTVDEEIRTRVLRKQMMALEVSDLREILNNVLHGVVFDE